MKRSIFAMALIVGLALTGCTMFNMDPAQALDPGAPPVGGTPVTMSMGSTELTSTGWHLLSALTNCTWGGTAALSVTATLGDVTKTLEEAVQARWIYRTIWQYNPQTGAWREPSVYDRPLLLPDEGFWLYVFVRDLILNFPTEAQFEKVRYTYPQTDAGFWTFVNYCQANWEWQNDAEDDFGQPQLVQGPPVTYARMTGDCDDFATMIAYYTQEYWGYNSFVGLLTFEGEDVGHAVAFVAATPDLAAYWMDRCGPNYPCFYVEQEEQLYIPIEQTPDCPFWQERGYQLQEAREWYNVVYERMDFFLNR